MRYDRIYKAKFIERPNRFIAYAELNGKKETVHVKNTGRCAELLRPGADIYIQESDNPSRKTRWDLIAVKKGSRMINMDSQIPNKVVKEWIEQGNLFENVTLILGDALEKISEIDEKFDFIFIDAAKGQYKKFFDLAYPKLSDNCIIFIDNIMFKGLVAEAEIPKRYKTIVRKLNEFISYLNDNHNFVLLPFGDGVGLVTK